MIPGVSAMQNYWLGIMAIAFVAALATWLLLVFNADRHPHARSHESLPHREVMGGEFEARDGGRQVMPIPGQASRPAEPVPGAAAEHGGVPSQRTSPQHEQAAPTDHS